MADRIVYWVSAPANSGNRMMVQCLCSAGCYGNPHKEEWFGEGIDDLDFRGLPDRLAFARSMPNGEEVVDPYPIAARMLAEDYRIVPITVHRKTEFAVMGQVMNYPRWGWRRSVEHLQVCAELMHEFAVFLGTPLITVPYEPFVRWPKVRSALFAQLDLPPPTHDTFNANKKYILDGPPLDF